MNNKHTIIIAGAGGIGEAAGLLLVEWSETSPVLFIGDIDESKAQRVADWIKKGSNKDCEVKGFHLDSDKPSDEMKSIFEKGNALLDCLPGSLAPKMAGFCKEYNMHYANLTEYVAETEEINKLAKNAKTGFVLQTGLAPGYINVLANGLFQQFCEDYGVDKADKLEMKVGALTVHATAPHFYGFTWSPVGVSTEYLKDAIVVRDHKRTVLPALSERSTIIIDGVTYEDDLTSGGAADLPDALAEKIQTIDYKTLRHPGHYGWVEEQVNCLSGSSNLIADLQKRMMDNIPFLEDDQIIVYAAVEGKTAQGITRRREITKKILPIQVGKHTLRAIQTTTAVPLIQAIQYLLENEHKGGVLLQSQIDPKTFLNGTFVAKVYGNV